MSFDIDSFVAERGKDAPGLHTYKTADTLAIVSASGYFDSIYGSLQTGDLIFVVASDKSTWLVVTVTGTTVTTAQAAWATAV